MNPPLARPGPASLFKGPRSGRLQDQVQVCFGFRGASRDHLELLADQQDFHNQPSPAGRFRPLSYTLRPTFCGAHARPGSWANFFFPQNSFVWENKKIDSQPPNHKTILHDFLTCGLRMCRLTRRIQWCRSHGPSTSEEGYIVGQSGGVPGSYPTPPHKCRSHASPRRPKGKASAQASLEEFCAPNGPRRCFIAYGLAELDPLTDGFENFNWFSCVHQTVFRDKSTTKMKNPLLALFQQRKKIPNRSPSLLSPTLHLALLPSPPDSYNKLNS